LNFSKTLCINFLQTLYSVDGKIAELFFNVSTRPNLDMSQSILLNRWRWLLIISLLICVIGTAVIWSKMSILSYLEYNKISQARYWIGLELHLTAINGIGSVLIFLTSTITLAILSFGLAFYLRLYQSDLRIVFQEIFDFLSLIPCIFWGFLFCAIVPEHSNQSEIGNLLLLFFVNSIMVFPMLLNAIFKAMNAISDEYIQTGYALGANNIEIASRLIVPKLVKPIGISIILIITRLITELAILTVIVGILSLYSVAFSMVLLVICSGILVFLLKR
jgi:ABC-type phosphate transport system permease subunit